MLATVWSAYLINDKNTLEKVQRCAARYVNGIYTYDVSVTQMLDELQWESLESCRERFRLITYALYHPETKHLFAI